MKKLWVIPLLVFLLAGCGKKENMETMSDVLVAPVAVTAQRIQLQLPEELSSPALESETAGKLYLCDDYCVTVQTVSAGDLDKTIRSVTGMGRDEFQILQTQQRGTKRYQWVWSANGETGTQVGRGCVLDDGTYHYVLTAMADEDVAGKVSPQWKEIFTSFSLATERESISTGS